MADPELTQALRDAKLTVLKQIEKVVPTASASTTLSLAQAYQALADAGNLPVDSDRPGGFA